MAEHPKHEKAAAPELSVLHGVLFNEAVEYIAGAVKKFTEAGLGGQAAADLAADIWKHFHKG